MRNTAHLPYGYYERADGSQVLFDRDYAPMWGRDADGSNVRKASGWIEHVKQGWFYDDYCSPNSPIYRQRHKKALARTEAALRAFHAGEPISQFELPK
jgi:hypothetical protein